VSPDEKQVHHKEDRVSRISLYALITWLVGCPILLVSAASRASDEELDAEARAAELRAQLFAADLVVQAEVANVVEVGDEAIVVLEVNETFRGATARKTIYAETPRDVAAELADREAIWLLKATDDPRRFVLDASASTLPVERAGEITEVLEHVTYATLDELAFTISLDKKTYKLDEPIRLTWSIENPTKEPIVIAEPENWGAALGLILAPRTRGGDETDVVLEIKPGTKHEADATARFRTLDPRRPAIGGTASLLRLIAAYGDAEQRTLPALEPGKYELTVRADTSHVAKDDAATPNEATLGALAAEPITFRVAEDDPFTLDEAKALLADAAGVEDIDAAIASDDPKRRNRALVAVEDYACPALMPLYEQMLRSDDDATRAAACRAITTWARHPAVVEANPFTDLIDELPLRADLSDIARAAADVAEAQGDTTMIPVLLRFIQVETVNDVSKRSVVLSVAQLTGLELDETDLEEAETLIKDWIERHATNDTSPGDP
jgi:hypothetical protein